MQKSWKPEPPTVPLLVVPTVPVDPVPVPPLVVPPSVPPVQPVELELPFDPAQATATDDARTNPHSFRMVLPEIPGRPHHLPRAGRRKWR